MSNQPESFSSLPLAVQRVAFALRSVGWVCFWGQSVLAVIAALILLFAIPFAFPNVNPGTKSANPATGVGLFFAVCGLLVLAHSAYRAFRYTQLSKKLISPGADPRPKKAETIEKIRFTLISNAIGMFLTILAAESIGGVLLGKSLSQPQALFNPAVNFNQFIQPLDIFVVLANTHAILAHFLGLISALWLLDRINKQ
ncbi:hypothetical protein BCD67_13030 [Oscillatoriales cyanobacterium USR001]|nr:hypothetical protein BCD67_13030 [Oscillatoriales cyanobacterium USR001]